MREVTTDSVKICSRCTRADWADAAGLCRACVREIKILKRLHEMGYALDGGNLDRELVEPDCIRDWIVYVEYG